MGTGRKRPITRVPVVVAALALAAVAAVVLGVWRSWTPALTDAAGAAPQAAAEQAGPPPSALALPDEATVLVFGDSWTYGSAASERELGYACRLGEMEGWDTVVDGVRGSGYLRPGIDGPDFVTRIADLDPDLDPDLVIVQGSINDRRQDLSLLADAVETAWDALATLYPDAAVVILGPAPQVLPVESTTAEIDRQLTRLAAARGWWYISPVAEEWITSANFETVIDTSEAAANHPSDAGHEFLAGRVADALERFAQPVAVEAADEQPDPARPGVDEVDGAPSER